MFHACMPLIMALSKLTDTLYKVMKTDEWILWADAIAKNCYADSTNMP